MIDCKNRNADGTCQVVYLLSTANQLRVKPDPAACDACTQFVGSPQSLNYVTCSLATSELHRLKMFRTDKHYHLLKCLENSLPNYGPGTVLKELFARYGFLASESCSCEFYAHQMNLWGDECVNHIPEIIGWIKTSAAKTEHPILHPTVVRWLANDLFLEHLIRYSVRKANRVSKSVRDQLGVQD